jgi:Domain of unknown function (DUF4337)
VIAFCRVRRYVDRQPERQVKGENPEFFRFRIHQASSSYGRDGNSMAHDLEEMHEHAHHGASDARLAPVTISMAILAVIAATVSLMGARIHAEEMLAETRATDQWAQYQAKVIRERIYQVFMDQLSAFALQDPAHVGDLKARYTSEIKRYQDESADIMKTANGTQAEVDRLDKRSNFFDLAEVLLESSLVICSITLLTNQRIYWFLGLLAGAIGFGIAIAGMLIRGG